MAPFGPVAVQASAVGFPGHNRRVIRRACLETFKGRNISWMLSESVLIDGQNLICTPGGPDAGVVALNKKTRAVVWTSKGLSDQAAYSSCIKFTAGGLPQIVTLTSQGLVGVSATSGRFLWRYDRPSNTTANCPTAVAERGRVFAATGYNRGGGAVDIRVSTNRVDAVQAWETTDMVCHHGGYVLVDGYLYGNHKNGWACIDFTTGRTMYTAGGVGKGSIIYADGMLYCLSEKGRVGLARATPERHRLVSEFTIPDLRPGESEVWAHPAISGARLYIRYGDNLYAYDIRAR